MSGDEQQQIDDVAICLMVEDDERRCRGPQAKGCCLLPAVLAAVLITALTLLADAS